MRWVVLALLVANLAVAGFFVGGRYLPLAPSERNAPLNVDRLSLHGQPVPARPEGSPTTRNATEALCLEWRGLSAAEFGQVRKQLKAMVGERVMSFAEMPVNTRQWVIFPPLPSAQSAAAKLGELSAAGVADAFVVKDGNWRNAISLGLYANAEAARRRVLEVEEKGVYGTRVESLPRQGTDFYFVIRSDDPDALKSLGEIRAAYPNSQQSRIACPS